VDASGALIGTAEIVGGSIFNIYKSSERLEYGQSKPTQVQVLEMRGIGSRIDIDEFTPGGFVRSYSRSPDGTYRYWNDARPNLMSGRQWSFAETSISS
jgi:hypothetical protein